MEAVFLVVNGVGLVLDLLTLVLDLNFLLVSSLLATLAWLLAFIYNLQEERPVPGVWSRSLQLASWPNRGGAPGAPQGGPQRIFSARIQGQDALPEAEENVRTNRTAPARG